jgi:hypothetical protein
MYNTQGLPVRGGISHSFANPNQPMMQQQAMGQQMYPPQPHVNMAYLETPKIVTNGRKLFTPTKGTKDEVVVPVDPVIPDVEKKKTPRTRKESGSTEIVRAGNSSPVEKVDGNIIETPTIYSYMETNGLLRETLGQIDSLNAELMQEFNNVRHSRTMKNKYNVLVGLSENVGSLINNRISVIKEINSTITKSNDVDYKKDKDRRLANANQDDDKYIADLYKSFIQNPLTNPVQPQLPQIDPSVFGSGIVRADIKNSNNTNNIMDASYLNYLSNLTPEQNLMRYEGNNNVKQVVVYDAATGNRFFQVMDISTGQVIPNVPTYDPMFMEDTTIDLRTKTAKNINLNETFPLVVINEGVTAQY